MTLSELESAKAGSLAEIAAAADAAAVEALRVKYVGRNGSIPALIKAMKDVPKEERPAFGKAVQAWRAEVESALAAKGAGASGAKAFDGDLSQPGDDCLLRTQTSPVQIRTMLANKPPVRVICPGRTFRRDTTDATHSANFHQIEGLYVDETATKPVSLADLKSVLAYFAREMMGDGVTVRFRPHFFPFTEPSVEVDFSCHVCKGKGCGVCKQSGWIEVAGAGMVDPRVFRHVGYDPERFSGYAFGFGVERIAMIKYGIPDIRWLYENDLRFLRQLG